MQIVHSIAELRKRLERERGVVFVPTMGNLHEGHIRLVEQARSKGGCTVASVFVTRLQFGPREDFDHYPRTLAADCEKLEAAGCDVVFAPQEREIYPEPQVFTAEPPRELGEILEGAVRPGHFRGVATVVLKLFNRVRPHAAMFGKKDYQQCRVLESMVRQLALPIEMILAETVRAPDGLALSSRNGYLSAGEREEAAQLYRVLTRVRDQVAAGERDFPRLEREGAAALAARGWAPDYVAIRRQRDLQRPDAGERALVVLAAARLGATRLIDNVELSL